GWAVRVPRGLQELNVQLSKLVEQLTVQLGRSPTVPELAKAAGVEEEEVLEALESGRAYSSLSLSQGGGQEDGEELDPLETLGEIEHQYEVSENRAILAPGFKVLDERERRILHLRFFEGLTQSQIAQQVGISQMHVSRLIRRALEKIREEIAADEDRAGRPTAAGRGQTYTVSVVTSAELRERFQRFFEERGHLRVPSHSLIPPADDPSTLFVVAGMQQFKPYFLGLREPPARRVVSVQKVLRAGGKDTDLEDVGRTDRHCSFFEMLGNFSFGDYFKDGAVELAWEFVTTEMGLDPARLWATVHEGNPALGLDEDTVAIEAWERVGIPGERIVRLGKDNFWQAADTGPCGPCSEIFYDRGAEHGCGRADCRPGCDCDRYMEFYNLVFMQYDLRPDQTLEPLPAENVDTGLGLERGSCVVQDVGSVFDTDGFRLIMDWVAAESGVAYGESPVATKAHRVLA